MRPRLLVGVLAVTALYAHAAERWQLQYLHDEDDRALVINELRFVTPERGMAVGALVDEKGKAKPAALVTTDGGRTWTETRVPDFGASLFFFDGDLGFMAGAKGIWRTSSFGGEWKKVKGARGLMSICFADREHGWAVGGNPAGGDEGTAYETSDGGKVWNAIKLPAIESPDTVERPGQAKLLSVVNYSSVAFADRNFGVIAGGLSRLPSSFRWTTSLPAEVMDGLALSATMTALLITIDGGKTWERASPARGRILRVQITPAKTGLLAIESAVAEGSWIREGVLSTVAGLASPLSAAPRVQEPPGNIIITDLHMTTDGTVYVAGYEPAGTLARPLIPAKVKVLRSTDGRRWNEMPVDYRAVARRAVLAAAGGNLWLGTDTGMILKLLAD